MNLGMWEGGFRGMGIFVVQARLGLVWFMDIIVVIVYVLVCCCISCCVVASFLGPFFRLRCFGGGVVGRGKGRKGGRNGGDWVGYI